MSTELDKLGELCDSAYKYLAARKNKALHELKLKAAIERALPITVKVSQCKETSEKVWSEILTVVEDVPRDLGSSRPYSSKSGALGRLILLIIIGRNIEFTETVRRESASPFKGVYSRKLMHTAAIKKAGSGGKFSKVAKSTINMLRKNIDKLEAVMQKVSSVGGFFRPESDSLLLESHRVQRELLNAMEADYTYRWEVYDAHGGWGTIPKEAFYYIASLYTEHGHSQFDACTKIARVLVTAGISPVIVPEDKTFANKSERVSFLIEKLARQIYHSIKDIKRIDITRGLRSRLSPKIIRGNVTKRIRAHNQPEKR